MLVPNSWCWWRDLSPTSKTCHRLIWSPTSVTNIDVTFRSYSAIFIDALLLALLNGILWVVLMLTFGPSVVVTGCMLRLDTRVGSVFVVLGTGFVGESDCTGTAAELAKNCFKKVWFCWNSSFRNEIFVWNEFESYCRIVLFYQSKNFLSTNRFLAHWAVLTRQQIFQFLSSAPIEWEYLNCFGVIYIFFIALL